MKNLLSTSIGALLCGGLLLSPGIILAQAVEETTTTTTTTSAGTITEFSPDSLIIRTESSSAPLRYGYSKTVTYVDETGAPVAMETVKSGLPVTVYYTKNGDTMTATKVIVRKSLPVPQTSGSISLGTITALTPEALTLTPLPLHYVLSKSVIYTDEAGRILSPGDVRAGYPATVHYTRAGDTLLVSKIIIKTSVATSAPAPLVTGTTTTTTTRLGTITEFTPDAFSIRTEASPDPYHYTYSKTTTYVDEDGAPVSMKTVKSGLPVTVYYTKDGDTMIATKVIVRKVTATPPPVIEVKKTKTTTTVEK